MRLIRETLNQLCLRNLAARGRNRHEKQPGAMNHSDSTMKSLRGRTKETSPYGFIPQ